jgi:hypothetical protein
MSPNVFLVLYACPTTPGWSRVFVTFVGRTDSRQRMPNAPGMPPAILALVNFMSTITPLFHANVQNNIIGGAGWVAWGGLGPCGALSNGAKLVWECRFWPVIQPCFEGFQGVLGL